MSGFLKSYSDAQLAATSIARSNALYRQGVRTPKGRMGQCNTEVEFKRIDGISGRNLLGSSMRELLEPLAMLHKTKVEGLETFDPFKRIRPRLSLVAKQRFRALLRQPLISGMATLHGDFHVGQLIRDGQGEVWIIDFDDLAIGPPEADLANFAAHIATSGQTRQFEDRLVAICADILHAWENMAHSVDPSVFQQYLCLALLRRHLKLREAQRPDFRSDVFSYLNDASARTSPSGNARCRG